MGNKLLKGLAIIGGLIAVDRLCGEGIVIDTDDFKRKKKSKKKK